MTDCIHANECTNDNCWLCSSCRHNRGKKNHYEPIIPINPSPWNPKPEPYPNPWHPKWIEWKGGYQSYKDKTECRLGPEPGYKLAPKPNKRLGTPYFLS